MEGRQYEAAAQHVGGQGVMQHHSLSPSAAGLSTKSEPESLMGDHLCHLNSNLQALSMRVERLRAFNSRVIGPVPETGSNGNGNPPRPSSHIGRFIDDLAMFDALLIVLDEELMRTGSIG